MLSSVLLPARGAARRALHGARRMLRRRCVNFPVGAARAPTRRDATPMARPSVRRHSRTEHPAAVAMSRTGYAAPRRTCAVAADHKHARAGGDLQAHVGQPKDGLPQQATCRYGAAVCVLYPLLVVTPRCPCVSAVRCMMHVRCALLCRPATLWSWPGRRPRAARLCLYVDVQKSHPLLLRTPGCRSFQFRLQDCA
jgi:hypothetical protein